MTHLGLVDLFKTFAKQHRKIKHGIGGRVSFFRMNSEAEIVIAISNKIDYPLLSLMEVSGNFAKTGDVSNRNYVTFDIRKQVGRNGDFDGIEAARSETKEIGDNIIALIDELCDEEGSCGPIEDFEVERVQWEFIGPINDNVYGTRYRFYFDKTAYNQYTQNLDEIFQTEFFIPLIDFDGVPLIDWNDEPLIDLE